MQKSYKGVKSKTYCEVVTMGRRCAAEGAWIQGQASPRMVADGSYGFVRLLSVTKGSVELQTRLFFEFRGLISIGYLTPDPKRRNTFSTVSNTNLSLAH